MTTALLTEALYALQYAADMTKPEDMSGCSCPICTVIPKIKAALAEPVIAPVPDNAEMTGAVRVDCPAIGLTGEE